VEWVQDVDLGRVAASNDRRATTAIVLLLAADELHTVDEQPEFRRPDHNGIAARLLEADRRRLERIRIGADVHLITAIAQIVHRPGRVAAGLGNNLESVESARTEQVPILVARRKRHPHARASIWAIAERRRAHGRLAGIDSHVDMDRPYELPRTGAVL